MTTKEKIIFELKKEAAGTRKIIESLKDEHLAWKPHVKSFSTLSLAQHVSNLPFWMVMILQTDSFDLGNPLSKLEPLPDAASLLKFFDDRQALALDTLEKAPDAEFEKTWKLHKGEFTIMEASKEYAMRMFAMNHLVHHRGQLTVYLRMQDIPVPGMYGPSADEK